MKAKRPDPPAGLEAAGKRAWRAAHAGLDADAEFTPKEFELLRLVAGQSDTVARLEREDRPRELSQARTALARLWTEINLTVDATDGMAPNVTNRRAQRAAMARWQAKKAVAAQKRVLDA